VAAEAEGVDKQRENAHHAFNPRTSKKAGAVCWEKREEKKFLYRCRGAEKNTEAQKASSQIQKGGRMMWPPIKTHALTEA